MRVMSIVSIDFCFGHPVLFWARWTVPYGVLLNLFEKVFEIPYTDCGGNLFSGLFFVFRGFIKQIIIRIGRQVFRCILKTWKYSLYAPISVRLLGLRYGCLWHVGAPLSDRTVWLWGSPCPKKHISLILTAKNIKFNYGTQIKVSI